MSSLREASRLGARTEAGVIVKSCFVGPSVVVDNALAEVEAVAQRSSIGAAQVRVHTLQFGVWTRQSGSAIAIRPNLAQHRQIESLRRVVVRIRFEAVRTQLQHVRDA
jgi:hypothetical protein